MTEEPTTTAVATELPTPTPEVLEVRATVAETLATSEAPAQ